MSALKELRRLMPPRPLNHQEALQIAELQAHRLRKLLGLLEEPFFPRDGISGQPKIEVVLDDHLASSGASHWNGRVWQITLQASEPFARQRFTLAHEYKHIVDYPFDEYCYPALYGHSSQERAEAVCDAFAAALLMPKVLVRRAWTSKGGQDPRELARLFGVSPEAMRVRLSNLGLINGRLRCRPPAPGLANRRTYFRASSPAVPVTTLGRVAAIPRGS